MPSEMPTVERSTMFLCTRGSSGMHSHTKGNKWSLHGVQLLIKTHSFVHYSFHPHSTTKWFYFATHKDSKRFLMDKSFINVADQSLPRELDAFMECSVYCIITEKHCVGESKEKRDTGKKKNMKEPNSLQLHNSEMSTYKCVKSISLHLV